MWWLQNDLHLDWFPKPVVPTGGSTSDLLAYQLCKKQTIFKYSEFPAQSFYFEVLFPAAEWVTNEQVLNRDSKLAQDMAKGKYDAKYIILCGPWTND